MSSKQARPSRTPFSLAELTASEPLSMDQVNARYPGEWVLLLVTALDEHHEASHGHVLCHSSLRREISRIVRRTHAADSDALLYIFVAGPRIRSGEDARKLLAQIADKWDDKNAWW
jgi:hypothetical protein